MKNFSLVARGIDTTNVALQLAVQPELWAQYPYRLGQGSPHSGTSDIWVRYNDPKNLSEHFNDEHDAIWYPSYYKLPALRPIIFGLMAKCEAIRLGGVLITKIPSGQSVKPHKDKNWHAEYYRTKVYVPIVTNEKVVNRCESERVVMNAGDAWFFNNLVEHEVTNDGPTERITLIVCMRCDG